MVISYAAMYYADVGIHSSYHVTPEIYRERTPVFSKLEMGARRRRKRGRGLPGRDLLELEHYTCALRGGILSRVPEPFQCLALVLFAPAFGLSHG